MNIPNFKPTKWDVYNCAKCKYTYHSSAPARYCVNEKHPLIIKQNIPFFIPAIKITDAWYKSWWRVENVQTKETYVIAASKFEPIVKNCTIEAGGIIRNQWWMFCKVGSATSLKWLPNDSDGQGTT